MWFKRDLRISDNHALLEATIAKEPLICIYNLDSERILRDDVDGIHIKWELDCLSLLKIDLENLGGKLIFNFGSIIGKLEEIHSEFNIKNIFSNEETGLQWSWNRDKAVSKWCKNNDINFYEFPTNGIIRRLKSRNNWKFYRDKRVDSKLIYSPKRIISPSNLISNKILDIET